ncbi:MAG: MCE family protein [Pseudonocardiaceae bacterium]
MSRTHLGQNLARGIAIACVLGLVVAGGLWWTLKDAGTKSVTAYFPSTIGLYEGNDVRVLGVKMGTVENVQPQGERVKVDMSYDRGVQIPADAGAVIIAPSLVSDRYVQLTPAYSGGPVMESGATVPEDRTAVPLEIDDLYATTHKLSTALGPEGANKEGSLSRFLETVAANIRGNGDNLNETVTQLSRLSNTLSGNKGDLFATVTNLAEFSTTLAASEQDVRLFERQLADVSGFLADERANLGATVKQLATTLESVHKFIQDNRGRIKSNVDKLASVTKVLVDQRAALAEILDVAPVALNNVIDSYNAAGGSLDTRGNFNELTMSPLTLICYSVQLAPDELDAVGDLCEDVTAPLQGSFPSPAEQISRLQNGQIPNLPLPQVDQFQRLQQGGGN